jgi:hypothetical protein
MNRKNVSTFLSFTLFIFVFSSILPVFSLQNNMYISSYGTINYSRSSLKAMWTTCVDINDVNLNRWVSGNTFILFLVLGHWEADHTIHYDFSDAYFTSKINQAKAYDSRFQVYAWAASYGTNGYGGQPNVDISTPAYRQAMANTVVNCMNRILFDGFHNNLEWVPESALQNQVDLENLLANSLHAIGRKASCAIVRFYPWQMTSITNEDYVAVMLYDDQPIGESAFKSAMDACLDASSSPMLIGCEVRTAEGVGSKLEYQLNWVTQQYNAGGPYAKFAGVAAYVSWEMNNHDANDWQAYVAFNV